MFLQRYLGCLHEIEIQIFKKYSYLIGWKNKIPFKLDQLQVKEMGATVQNCGCLATDLAKIFDAYWYLATPDSSVPTTWPVQYDTLYNSFNPMSVNFNGTNYDTFLSVSYTDFSGLSANLKNTGITYCRNSRIKSC